jgi:hypothetical protein
MRHFQPVYVTFIPFGNMKLLPSEVLAVRMFYNHQQLALLHSVPADVALMNISERQIVLLHAQFRFCKNWICYCYACVLFLYFYVILNLRKRSPNIESTCVRGNPKRNVCLHSLSSDKVHRMHKIGVEIK